MQVNKMSLTKTKTKTKTKTSTNIKDSDRFCASSPRIDCSDGDGLNCTLTTDITMHRFVVDRRRCATVSDVMWCVAREVDLSRCILYFPISFYISLCYAHATTTTPHHTDSTLTALSIFWSSPALFLLAEIGNNYYGINECAWQCGCGNVAMHHLQCRAPTCRKSNKKRP